MLSRFSVKKPYTVFVGIVMVIVLGIVSFSNMTADLLPSMNLPYAIVMTTYTGASPEEVEQAVSRPVEQSMATISNIKNITSVSSQNTSLVILEFENTANMDSVTIEMRESLDQIKGYWSESVGNPIIMKINPDMMPIMVAAVDADEFSNGQISELVTRDIVPELESVEGVARVNTVGNVEESIHVVLNQEKIDKLDKSISKSLDKSFLEAQEELDKAKSEIESGKNQLESGKSTMADQLSEAESQLNSSQNELIKGQMSIEAQEAALAQQETELLKTEKEVEEKEAALNRTGEELEKQSKELNSTKATLTTLQTTLTELEASKKQLEESMKTATGEELKQLQAQLATVENSIAAIDNQLAGRGMTRADISVKLTETETALTLIATAQKEIANGKAQVAAAKKQIKEGKAAIAAGKEQIAKAKQEIESGQITVSEALEELNKNQILASIEMSINSAKLESGEAELKNAQEALEENKNTAYENASVDNLLTIEMLEGILAAQNFSMPAGYINENGIDYLIRVGDKIKDKKELQDLVILDLGMEEIDPIRLSHVADVQVQNNADKIYAKVNGNSAVILSIEKQTGYSTGDVTKRLDKKFEDLTGKSESLHITALMDQGVYIDLIVKAVLQNIIYGAILAILILLLFLKDFRPTFVIACSIPISIMFAIVLMYFSGVTINIISLSGLALGVGMLVDNSIVVIENIYRLRNKGLSAKKAAVEGAKQVAGAIAASTLTTICVFAPIVFTNGITRQLFVEMGLTIAYSLVASLVIALTLVPSMSATVLNNTREKEHKFFDKIQGVYGKVIVLALKYKVVVLVIALVLLGVSVAGASSNGTAFMPEMESTQVTVELKTPQDSTLAETAEVSDEVISRILEIKDVKTVGAMNGGNSMINISADTPTNKVTMYLILKEKKELTGAQLEEAILEKTKDLNCKLNVETSTMDMSALGGSGIEVQIKGRDLDTLQTLAEDIARMVERVQGTKNVSDGMKETTDEFRIQVNKEKAMKYNLTVAQIYKEIREQVSETASSTSIATNTEDYDVFIEAEEQITLTRKAIKKLKIETTDKEGKTKKVKLSKLVDFVETKGLSSIRRDAQERYITISAEVDSEHNVGLVGAEIQEQINQYSVPDGYTIELKGENESIDDAMGQLILMLLLGVLFIYLIMVAQFQSLLSPFIIMFTIPLAFTGGFLGLFLTGSEISVIAMIGFVMLSGIIVNNGIVLVDYINQLRKRGMSKKEAIAQAGSTRLRPILMTAFTTVLGLLTMAMGIGLGADMIQPMAIVTIGGLLYGTLLTLLVVPCIYDLFHREKSMVEEEI